MSLQLKLFLKTGESVIATQRAFCAHFILYQNDSVPDRTSVLLWVEISIRISIIPT